MAMSAKKITAKRNQCEWQLVRKKILRKQTLRKAITAKRNHCEWQLVRKKLLRRGISAKGKYCETNECVDLKLLRAR